MTRPRASGSPVPSLLDVKGRPVSMPLRAERRNVPRRAAIVRRITTEFRDLPGLILSVPQVSRLLGVDEAACERILAALTRDGLLRRRASGSYCRAQSQS